MKVVEIAFIAYPVTDLARARKFYEETLGLQASRVFGEGDSAWVEYDIGPNTFAITNMIPQWQPSTDGGVIGFEVEDLDAAMSRIKEHGATIINEPTETPVCHMAVVTDPDGNAITIHKRKA